MSWVFWAEVMVLRSASTLRARACAERHFDESLCFQRHEELYAELIYGTT